MVAYSLAWLHLSIQFIYKMKKSSGDKTHPCWSPTPRGMALIACHLPDRKPLVGGRMTLWHVTTDYQRHTLAKPSKVYPEELGHVLFEIKQTQRDLCHISKISLMICSE